MVKILNQIEYESILSPVVVGRSCLFLVRWHQPSIGAFAESVAIHHHGHHVHHGHHGHDHGHDHDHDHGRDRDHDERQRPLPRPLKEVQRMENRTFFRKSVPEKWHYFFKEYMFFVLRNDFYEKSRFCIKNTIRLLLEHVLEYPHKKLHRIAFFMLKIDSTMLKLWSFLILT